MAKLKWTTVRVGKSTTAHLANRMTRGLPQTVCGLDAEKPGKMIWGRSCPACQQISGTRF